MKRFFAVLILMFICSAFLNAGDYYVSTSGDDGTGDGSFGNPWRHVDFALRTAQIGPGGDDTVYVMPGVYNERIGDIGQVQWPSGTSGTITVKGYGGGESIIDATGIDLSGGDQGVFNLDAKENWVYEDLTIRNVDTDQANLQAGICIGPNGIVRNCKFVNTGEYGVWSWQADNILIEDCTFIMGTDSDFKAGIEMGGVDGYTLRGNTFILTAKTSINASGSLGEIYGNICTDGGRGISLGSNTDLNVYQNIVSEAGSGIFLLVATATPAANIQIYNNILYGNEEGFHFATTTTAQDGTINGLNIVNNVFFENTGRGIKFNKNAAELTNVTIRNNIFTDNGTETTKVWDTGQLIAGGDSPGALTVENNMKVGYTSSGAEVDGASQIDDEAGTDTFVNPAGNDFTIKYTSAAFDGGSSTLAPADDFDGTSRPRVDAVDIGAYELVPDIQAGNDKDAVEDAASPDTTITGSVTPSFPTTWTQVGTSSPNNLTATILDPTSLTTGLDFTGISATPETFTFRISLSSDATTYDEVVVSVYPTGTVIINAEADTGTVVSDTVIIRIDLVDTIDLLAELMPVSTTATWTVTSGDASKVNFGSTNVSGASPDTTATFLKEGIYELTLSDDGVSGETAVITVTVEAQPKGSTASGGCTVGGGISGSVSMLLMGLVLMLTFIGGARRSNQ